MRIASGLIAALFGLGMAVQYNDPDPAFWIAVYALAAAPSAAFALGRGSRAPTLVAAALLLVLAIGWTPALREARPQSFDSFGMHSERDERVREAAGLWLCAGWTALLAWRLRAGVAR